MSATSPKSDKWSAQELSMITTVDIFLHKPGIMKKAEEYLTALKDAMVRELASEKCPWPDNTDLTKGQLVRGENHKGFPFMSQDIPQFFSKTEMFTYRTLFWWGHCLCFALILKGKYLEQYMERAIGMREEPSCNDIYIATTPTPWEWSQTEENFRELSRMESDELKTLVDEIQYIKLCRFYPVNAPAFSTLDWTAAGVQTWQDLSQITKR
jgi:hypothetical protein